MRLWIMGLAITVASLLPMTVEAQTIRLKNGNTLHGEVERLNDQQVAIDIPGVGKMTFDQSEIAAIEESSEHNSSVANKSQPISQARGGKTDRERDGLRGAVKTLETNVKKVENKFGEKTKTPQQYGWKLITYDREGNRKEEERGTVETYLNTIEAEGMYSYVYEPTENKTKKIHYRDEEHRKRRAGGTTDEINQYDAKGDVAEVNRYDPKDGTLVYKLTYAYDAQGRQIEQTYYKADGSMKAKIVSTYDAEGRKAEDTEYHHDELFTKTVYTYDSNGNVLEETRYTPKGVVSERHRYSYVYDGHGNWTKRSEETASVSEKFGQVDLADTFEPSVVVYRAITYFQD